MINLADFEGRAHRGELEPADVVQAYNRIMELDQINSTVKRRAKDLTRRREAWRRGVLNYARSQAPRFGLELSQTPAGKVPPVAEFAMAGMDMGSARFPLRQVGDGRWQADIMLPVCVTGGMEWEATVIVETAGAVVAAPFRFRTEGT